MRISIKIIILALILLVDYRMYIINEEDFRVLKKMNSFTPLDQHKRQTIRCAVGLMLRLIALVGILVLFYDIMRYFLVYGG